MSARARLRWSGRPWAGRASLGGDEGRRAAPPGAVRSARTLRHSTAYRHASAPGQRWSTSRLSPDRARPRRAISGTRRTSSRMQNSVSVWKCILARRPPAATAHAAVRHRERCLRLHSLVDCAIAAACHERIAKRRQSYTREGGGSSDRAIGPCPLHADHRSVPLWLASPRCGRSTPRALSICSERLLRGRRCSVNSKPRGGALCCTRV